MTAHSSVVGGSTAARVIACPGSVEHNKKYPNKSSDYAEEGTALHEAIAFILDGNTEHDREIIGMTFNGYLITEDLFESAIQPCLEFFDELDEEYGGIEFLTEQKLEFKGIRGAFGIGDLIGKGKIRRTLILDWKFGAGVPVYAENNKQLKFYGYAGLNTKATKHLFEHTNDYQIELAIAQPRLVGGPSFSRWVTNVTQLKIFARELRRAVEHAKTEEGQRTFNAGDHCKFCPGMPGCPVHLSMVEEALSQEDKSKLAEDVSTHLKKIKPLEAWIKAVQSISMSLAEDGQAIPGYKLVAKKPRSKWANEEKTREFFANVEGIEESDYLKQALIGITDARKLAKKNDLVIDDLILSRSSGTELVEESDKREAIVVSESALEELANILKR